mmetsp:Transcript_9280/g.12846  ORF Transcript_9280/g.12846 Transcript_9280/m.12846 type:complete len:281 (+) Transcript_9280:269-1111(+)
MNKIVAVLYIVSSVTGTEERRRPLVERCLRDALKEVAKSPKSQQKFIMISQRRSGSTWLMSMLNSHPAIMARKECIFEFFNRDKEETTKSICGKNFINALNTGTRGVHGMITSGFKIQVPQFFPFCTEQLQRYIQSHNVDLFLMFRENLLRMVVSSNSHLDHIENKALASIAQHTAVNIPTGQALLHILESLDTQQTRTRQIFPTAPEFKYEDLVANPEIWRHVLEAIRINTSSLQSINILQSPLIQLHSAIPIANTIRNFRDVRATLNGTRFQSFLYDD